MLSTLACLLPGSRGRNSCPDPTQTRRLLTPGPSSVATTPQPLTPSKDLRTGRGTSITQIQMSLAASTRLTQSVASYLVSFLTFLRLCSMHLLSYDIELPLTFQRHLFLCTHLQSMGSEGRNHCGVLHCHCRYFRLHLHAPQHRRLYWRPCSCRKYAFTPP